MMKIFHTIIFAFLIMFSFLSCNKDIILVKPPLSFIKNIEFIGINTSFYDNTYFYYDSLNRLIKTIEGTDTTIYENSIDKIQTKKIHLGIESLNSTLFLNSEGLVDSIAEYLYTYKFIYDTNGYRIKEIEYTDNNKQVSSIRNYIIINSNLASIIENDLINKSQTVFNYSDFDQVHFNTTESINMGQAYYGKSSEHYAKKHTVGAGSIHSFDVNYTINYDSEGRIQTLNDGQTIQRYTYY